MKGEGYLFSYDATTTKIFEIAPYIFFAAVGIVFAASLFILLLLKYDYSIPRYTKIFAFSGIGMLIGAKIFGFLTGLYIALANRDPINTDTFLNTGIVFYGGMLGFLFSFLLICKIWNKQIDYGVFDLAVVCIPLFHFWGRFGCFFGGCCYGIESNSWLSVLYTHHIHEDIITVSRIPIQLMEAVLNMATFVFLLKILSTQNLKGCVLPIYLAIYATMRIILEFFRGDSVRGVWNGISFSQVTSILILVNCISLLLRIKSKEKKNESC